MQSKFDRRGDMRQQAMALVVGLFWGAVGGKKWCQTPAIVLVGDKRIHACLWQSDGTFQNLGTLGSGMQVNECSTVQTNGGMS
jgi:hypothetical protein